MQSVGRGIHELAIRKLRDTIAVIKSQQEEDDSFLVPRKLGTRVLGQLTLMTEALHKNLLNAPERVAHITQLEELTRDFFLKYLEKDTKLEIANHLLKYLTKHLPSL